MNNEILEAINTLEQNMESAKSLPDDIFYFLSRHTPLVNVDLLIRNAAGHTLLSWRNDEHCGTGWHVPGGIIRFKEQMIQRVHKVAELEIRAMVSCSNSPIGMHELIRSDQDIRGHFISFLFPCTIDYLLAGHDDLIREGQLKWHEDCPEDLLQVQSYYRHFI